MTPARAIPPVLVALAAVYAASMMIVGSAMFAAKPAVIGAGVAFDLTLTASAIVWWLGVRRARWPGWTVAVTFALGLAAGRRILPGSIAVTALAGAWVAVELAISAVVISRLRTVIRAARAHRGAGPVDAVEAGLIAARVPRRMAGILATDIVAFGLGLGGWFRRAPRAHPGVFAMHRRKSWTAIALLLLFLIAGETVAVHVFIAHWTVVTAWIVTATSIYAGLWLAADLHALRVYPLRVTADAVVVSVGLRWRLTIPRAAITGVTLGDQVPPGALKASVVEPTVIVTLAEPVEARGPFGIRRRVTEVALTVDEPERLITELQNPIAASSNATLR